MASKTYKAPPGDEPTFGVEVSVHDATGAPLGTDARVALVAGERSVELTRKGESSIYAGRAPNGTYDLAVSSGRRVSPPRRLTIDGKPARASAYVGDPDWPFYRMGENAVPFEPPGDLIAVAFPDAKPDPKEAERLIGQLVKDLPLATLDGDPGQRPKGRQAPQGSIQAEGAIWIFRFTKKDTPKLRAEIDAAVRAMTGDRGRVGIPTDMKSGQWKVIDNRFVVRFRDDVEPARAMALIEEAGASVLRGFRQARNARLIAFPPGDHAEHLARIEEWHAAGLLVYGEPDIMAEITDDAFPQDPPDDPTYASQANLTLQNVPTAWQILHAIDPDLTLGDPSVYVASLDRGLDVDHPDIGGNLTDGTAQVARCYDFSGLRECSVAGYTPDTDHGMGVYGIIAALTDNNNDVAGIAPNTHQIVMERPNLTSANYPDVLLWAAGFTTGNTSSGWPAEPLANGAAIISCSHGSDGLALSGIMDDTFQDLTDNGRGGLGTIVVYSAGNANTLITGFRTWAAHPNTIAVANSAQPDGMGIERKVGTSNFGPEIDVCAQGAGAPSLDASGGEQTFGGTSAAAPTVAAVAALILSRSPGLTWTQMRDRLRNTAVQIDAANTDPVGQYVGGFSQWYGFGRINASSAVCGADPQVTQDTFSITFSDIPEGETTVRAADFTVNSCAPVTLQIVSGPGAAFTTPLGTTDSLGVAGDPGPRPAKLWVGYTAGAAGSTDSGSVTIEWLETGQQWVVPISANVVPRPTAAVELVLDKSGSMDWGSGIPDLPKRIDVLKASVPPLLEVMYDDNALGVVSFDHDAYPVMPVTAAGVPVFGAGRVAGRMAVDSHTPNPAGGTAIGDGVELGQAELAPEVSYDVRAMIVLTDGHETAGKYIADVDHLIGDRVYAIGLGTADVIQPTALTALTNGTGGYLLLTGDLGGDDYFLLAKYYLQILAGVTNEDIVLDPQGFLQRGQCLRIPFHLAEADISADVILLTPAPQVVRFCLETPAGDLITPAVASGLPTTRYVAGENAALYRTTLPVPVGAGAGAGRWHAVLEIEERSFKKYVTGLRERNPDLFEQMVAHGVRYSLNVHSYSNLRMRCSLAQDGYEPGATLTLQAVLTEYGLPVDGSAKVNAELKRPDGTTALVALVEEEPGIFRARVVAGANGVYRFRLRASGLTMRQRPFTREQIVTGAVWRNGNDPPPTGRDDPDRQRETLCELLHCLIGRKVMTDEAAKRLEAIGIDLEQLRRCLAEFCDNRPERSRTLTASQRAVLQSPAFIAQLRQLLDDTPNP